MKAVDFAVSQILPPDMRQDSYDLSKKGMSAIMGQIASRYPEKFAEITHKLGLLGRRAAWYQGYTVGPEDTKPVIDTDAILARMDEEISELRKRKLAEDEFEEKRNEIYLRYSNIIEKETIRRAVPANNAFAIAAASGARGNASHSKALLSTPGVYSDASGRIIPMFVRNSFARGVRPAELLAGTYGGRAAVVSTKKCLLKGTEVMMADGSVKAIEDVEVGDLVVGVSRGGVTRPARVLRTFNQGLQDVWRFDLRYSNSNLANHDLCCTLEHKVLMNDAAAYGRERSRFARGKRSTAPSFDLFHAAVATPAGHLGNNRRKAILSKGGDWEGVREPWAKLLGLLTGDGCTTRQVNKFYCADPLLLVDIEPYLTSLKLRISKDAPDDPLHYSYSVTTADYTPAMNSASIAGTQGFPTGGRVPINEVLERYGLRDKYSYDKTLPTGVWAWDDLSVLEYLAAYLACDGSVWEGTNARGRKLGIVSWASTSLSLVNGIKRLLMVRFGIHTGQVEVRTKGGFGDCQSDRKHTLFCCSISRFQCFTRFSELIAPHLPGVKRMRTAEILQTRTQEKDKNTNATMSLHAKELLGLRPCYDIEVDNEDHLFMLGNGLIVSNSTAKGGDFLKILTQNTSLFNVTTRDCGTDNGIDIPASDSSLVGRVLAREAAGIPAGGVIDRAVAARLRKELGDKPVIVRSAMACKARHGLCAHCVGVQADGKFPRIGESVGITAGDAIGEPIVQGSLNQKHNSGMAKGKRAFSGFDVISQFVQVPEEFKDRAAVAEHDGEVEKIEPAPQGGTLVWVSGKQHLVLPGFEPTVKVGEKVEAGDVLSEGLASPADIVRLKGLGAGREYYRERLSQILADSGNPPDRRNMEIVSRAAVDNLVVTDPDIDDPWLPDDHVREADFMAGYREPEDTRATTPDGAVGGYLQRPVLHFTVGTRITPKLAARMASAGVNRVPVSYQAPKFEADMPRLRVAAHSSRDWLQSLGTSYLSSQLQQSLERGDETNVRENVHYGPRLAYGVDAGSGAFAENIERTGMF